MQSLRRRVWAARVFDISLPDAFEKQFFNGLLDALYREYALLLKPGYQPQGDRAERRAQLERFFEHIDHPPRSTSGPNLFEAFKIIEPDEKAS